MSKILPMRLGHLGRVFLTLALTMSALMGLGLAVQEQVSAQGDEVVSISPADQEVSRGEMFTVDVMISEAENLWSFEFNLIFDPDILEVQGVELNDAFWADSDRTPQEFTESVVGGTLNYVVISEPPEGEPNAPGPDGDGKLATVTFEAIGQGTSALDLQGTTVYSGTEERDPTEEDGSVTSLFAMAVDPEESVVNPDDEFTVDVMIMGAQNLWSFEFNLSFDPNVLEVQGVELNPAFWAGSDRTPVEFTESVVGGTLNYVVISEPPEGEPNAPGPDGDGVLATITFKALEEGESDLDLSDLESFAGTVPETPDDMDGKVYVVAAGVSVKPEASSVSRCGTIEIQIVLGGDVTNVWGYDLSLDWDADIFEVQDVEIDPAFWADSDRTPKEFTEAIDNDAGTLNYVVISEPPVGNPDALGPDAPGVLAIVTLHAIGVGESDLHLHDVEISEGGTDVDPAALTDGTAEATKEAVEFEFDPISSPQVAGQPFMVTITALNEDGDPAENFSGMVSLSDTTGTLTPDGVEFEAPEVTASMTITKADMDITITAEGMNPCEVTITGESNAFDVDPDVENPESVTIAPKTKTLMAGECVTFTLTGKDAYGNTFDVTDDEDTDFMADGGGTIDGNKFCAETVGDWTVTGTYLTVSDDAAVTVEPGELFRIEVAPDPATVLVGATQQFEATGYDAFDNEVAITPTWDVTDADAGTIDATGLFTASFNIGTYEDAVEATCSTVSGYADVCVEGFQIFLPIVMNNYSP